MTDIQRGILNELIVQLMKNKLHLSGVHPYNSNGVFDDSREVTMSEKRIFCVFLDLVRQLIAHSLIEERKHKLYLFGQPCATGNDEQLLEILMRESPKFNNCLHFISNRMINQFHLKGILDKLDDRKIKSLYEDANRRLSFSE